MKKIIILILILILISGCSNFELKNNNENQKTITYIIPEENKIKTYSVEENENLEFWLIKTREKRNELNKWRFFNDLEEEEKDRLIDKRTRRWVRIIDDELITGYDEEQDELFYKFLSVEDLKQQNSTYLR